MTPSKPNGQDVWKVVAVGFISFSLGIVSMNIREHIMFKDFVTKAEAQDLSPWLKDKEFVIRSLERIEKDLRNLNVKIDSLK